MKLPRDCHAINVRAILGVILSLVHKTVCAECPPDAPERAMQCVARISGTTRQTGSSLLSDWDFQKIGQACEDGEFTKGISCAERIIDSCRNHPDQAVYLHKYLNVPLMKQGVNHLCKKTIIDFNSDSECIRKQKPLVKTCADAELSEFLHEVNQLEGDQDLIKEAACQFMHRVFDCQVNSVRSNCGENPANELSKVIYYFVPPYCSRTVANEHGNGVSDAVHIHLSILLCFILQTFLKVLCFS